MIYYYSIKILCCCQKVRRCPLQWKAMYICLYVFLCLFLIFQILSLCFSVSLPLYLFIISPCLCLSLSIVSFSVSISPWFYFFLYLSVYFCNSYHSVCLCLKTLPPYLFIFVLLVFSVCLSPFLFLILSFLYLG